MPVELAEVLNRLDRMAVEFTAFADRQAQLEAVHERSYRELKNSIASGWHTEKDKLTPILEVGDDGAYSPTEGPLMFMGKFSRNLGGSSLANPLENKSPNHQTLQGPKPPCRPPPSLQIPYTQFTHNPHISVTSSNQIPAYIPFTQPYNYTTFH